MYYLGVDAGGTKCRARLTNLAGQVIGQGISGPANAHIGIDNVFSALMEAAQSAARAAGLNAVDVKNIQAGIGVAGISRTGAKQALLGCGFPFQSTNIHTDGHIANLGAHSGRDGGVVIIGTGSIAIGSAGGKNIRIGGYGFPISDEGSGAYMGLQAIRITLRASDGRLTHTDLTNTVLQKFNGQIPAIISWMDKAAASDYAALAPYVVKAAKDGDRHGRLIAHHSVKHIDLMVRGLRRQEVPRCALLGGLSAIILPWLSAGSRAFLSKPDGDALDGALLLARKGPRQN